MSKTLTPEELDNLIDECLEEYCNITLIPNDENIDVHYPSLCEAMTQVAKNFAESYHKAKVESIEFGIKEIIDNVKATNDRHYTMNDIKGDLIRDLQKLLEQ